MKDKELFKKCKSGVEAALLEDMLIINHNREVVLHIREYLNVMKDEPDEYILLSKVYHDLRRIIGDE